MSSYLITGAARGLGLEMAAILAARPSPEVSLVITTARKASPALQTLVQKSSGHVVIIPAEVTDEKTVQEAADEVKGIVGDKGIDVLVNNAGIMNYTPDGIETM
jgi:NAD(P)-dependent dehydrogenase (short-subunit alcohol dehydrogenase family)